MGGGGFKRGDRVRVVAGRRAGREGEVVRVIKAAGEPGPAALVLVRFAGGGEDYHVAADLEKLESVEDGQEGQ